MDERILTIVKAMAMGYLAEDDQGWTCLHCNIAATSQELRKDIEVGEEIQHKPDCPVMLARQWLRDNGTPMNIYCMTGSHCHMITRQGPQWQKFVTYTLATSEQEVLNNWTSEYMRNLQATFVRELPL